MRKQHLLIFLWILALLGGMRLDLWHERQFLPPPEERTAQQNLVDVFGEVKTVVALYLWFRMDIYHEVLESQGKDEGELLPLLRMTTLLDPSMTDSYDQLVWDLYKGQGKVETAQEVLDEGIRLNPSSYELWFRKALLHHMEGQYEESMKAASKAIGLTDDRVQQADCLRLIYWSSKELERRDIQRRAMEHLVKLRPNDPVWQREKKKFEQGEYD